MSAGERVLRIGVSSLLTLVFAAWSVDLFASQPSEITSVPFPKCATGDRPCLEHALHVAFSNPDGRWATWVIWTFWALMAAVWLAACVLILWSPRRNEDPGS